MRYALALCLILASCEKESNPVIPPPPTMSGRWDLVLVGTQTLTGLLDITDNNGAITCTASFLGATFNFSGTLSAQNVLAMYSYSGTNSLHVNATVTANKNSLSGRMTYYEGTTPVSYFDMTATKR